MSMSTMLPWIFEIIIDDEVLAKEFWIIAMTMRPGARKCANGMPATVALPRPSARVKMARNSSTVTTGAKIVWVETFMKRWTSLL